MERLLDKVKRCARLLLILAVPYISTLTLADAHQSVNPSLLKLVGKAPNGALVCRDADGPILDAACIEKGRKLFETGTFGGNGRTCASCHPANNNFTIDVPYINKLPRTDKLFVNEQISALTELETPLLRKYGLICENLDGFGNLGRGSNDKQNCVMRSVIATEGLAASAAPDGGQFDDTTVPGKTDVVPTRPLFPLKSALGWGGDGSPGDGSLRNFAIGAVVQHFPKRLNRVAGIDFVLPTEDQLDAMEAFQLSLGRTEEMNLNPDPYAEAKNFNCVAYSDGTNKSACDTSPVFELKSMTDLISWRTANFKGNLLEFTDPLVTNGQILFFGGIPSQKGIRTCSGCHIQAGAGSELAQNQPKSIGFPAGNRQRATGASFASNSPICLPEAQNVIYNADGGFGAGEQGFPFTQESNYNTPESCALMFSGKFLPTGGCLKHFGAKNDTKPTEPPLSNEKIIISSRSENADVGTKNDMLRNSICVGSSIDDTIYMTGTGFFSTPSVIEAASTIPLFHNNIAPTVEDAVRFYASDAFHNSASGNLNKFLVDTRLPSGQGDIVTDIGAFLRAINAINNLKISARYLSAAVDAVTNTKEKVQNAKLALKRASDAIGVLTIGGPLTANYLGGQANLFASQNVVSSIQSARNRITLYGNTEAGFGKLTTTELILAKTQISTACRAMLTPTAANSYCP